MVSKSAANPTLEKVPLTPIGHAPKYTFEGHYISNFIFLHDNAHIVSSSLDGTMRKWNFETGLPVGDPWKREGAGIWALELSPNGQTIACGRIDGSVQTWNTDGEMIKGNWTSHNDAVWSLSWSPCGSHLASGSGDGTIIIRNAGSRSVEVGPIQTNQHWVCSLANSPSGDRIASGGYNKTICIWECSTGNLLVGPIEELGCRVDSVVWSSDSSKLYCASDKFAHVLDSASGAKLHRLQHDDFIYSVALSPKYNVLACVGVRGAIRLWDTESHQPLGHPFHQEDLEYLHYVSFSPDGRYLAYGGNDKITLRIFQGDVTQQNTLLPSCFSVDAANPCAQLEVTNGRHDDSRANFFQHSEPCTPSSSQRSRTLPARRLWNFLVPSRHHRLAEQRTPQQPNLKHNFFTRHIRPQSNIVSTVKPKKSSRMPSHTMSPANQNASDVNHNPQSAQSSSAAVQPESASDNQYLTQITAEPAQEQYDYGCWSNFRHSLSRTPRHSVDSSLQPITN